MHIHGNVNEILGDRLVNDIALLICGIFRELLAKVVTKGVWGGEWVSVTRDMNQMAQYTSHQVCKMAERCSEDHIVVFGYAFFEFLL